MLKSEKLELRGRWRRKTRNTAAWERTKKVEASGQQVWAPRVHLSPHTESYLRGYKGGRVGWQDLQGSEWKTAKLTGKRNTKQKGVPTSVANMKERSKDCRKKSHGSEEKKIKLPNRKARQDHPSLLHLTFKCLNQKRLTKYVLCIFPSGHPEVLYHKDRVCKSRNRSRIHLQVNTTWDDSMTSVWHLDMICYGK